jgi:hypothetical protein
MTAGTGAAAISFSELRPVLGQQATRDTQKMKPELAKVKALVFDTFGTRGSVSLIAALSATSNQVITRTWPRDVFGEICRNK